MSEVIQRHTLSGYLLPKLLYTDCSCCNGKPRKPSVAALWRSTFDVKLDAMHLMLRIGREMNAGHPRHKTFLVDLSQAIFYQHLGDHQQRCSTRRAIDTH